MNIVGHRGAAGYAPENTPLSFQTAVDLGCDRTECDVRLTKDRQLVVIHDDTVDRTTDGTGKVREMTLKEIKKLNCEQNQKVPTLREVIDVCKGKIDLQIELKEAGDSSPVSGLIKTNKLFSHVVISSFDPPLLAEIKDYLPKIKSIFLFKKTPVNLERIVQETGVEYLGPRGDIVDEKLIELAHHMDLKVYAYKVNDLALGEKLKNLGAEEIGTDFPELFLPLR